MDPGEVPIEPGTMLLRRAEGRGRTALGGSAREQSGGRRGSGVEEMRGVRHPDDSVTSQRGCEMEHGQVRHGVSLYVTQLSPPPPSSSRPPAPEAPRFDERAVAAATRCAASPAPGALVASHGETALTHLRAMSTWGDESRAPLLCVRRATGESLPRATCAQLGTVVGRASADEGRRTDGAWTKKECSALKASSSARWSVAAWQECEFFRALSLRERRMQNSEPAGV
jgi:hypothetical protein